MNIPFDICANYHKGNENSQLANLATDKEKDIERILKFMRSRPGQKTYVKELIRELGMLHQTASARLSDLKKMGKARNTNEKVQGCGVVELVPVQEKLW